MLIINFLVNYSKDKIKALNYFESVELNEERVEALIELNLECKCC